VDVKARIAAQLSEVIEWRHHFHAHPELAYQEHATAAFVALKLKEFGLEVREGVGRTGVVGVLRRGNGPMIGLRADMDALPIVEGTGVPYASTVPGCMHACGHDGHTAMLLAAARILAESPPEGGSVVFIFQPAEEGEAGGKAMIEDGLLQDFPVQAVYGLHNWPGVPFGQFAVHTGPVMAAFDTFEVVVEGRGSHGAMPHQGIDAITVATQLCQAWQLIVSRGVEATDAAVISVTQIHAGDAWNVLPDSAVLRGTVRTLRADTRAKIRQEMADRADLLCRAFGAKARFAWQERYPTTINTAREAELAAEVGGAVTAQPVLSKLPPSMASEDFAYMLQQRPGAYVWLGAGSAEGGKNLHSPRYDFDDNLIPIGVEYWVTLALAAIRAT
jgi:hippurate hydrolase